MNEKVLNMKLPKDLYEQIKKISENKNISMASLVRMVMTEYCNKEVAECQKD